jgi:hypothetical protein
MRLTGNEKWFKIGLAGETIWARRWGDSNKDWWWPIVHVELDCGLIKIDVCGQTEIWGLDDCAELRIGLDRIVPNEEIWDQPVAF